MEVFPSSLRGREERDWDKVVFVFGANLKLLCLHVRVVWVKHLRTSSILGFA